jgi:hypothetical protein
VKNTGITGSKEQFVIPESALWEYIGDLSQDLLECSYNEDEVREAWVNGNLNEYALYKLVEYPDRLKHYRREDGKYSEQLTAYVAMHGGWAPNWGPEISPLSDKEQAVVTAFLDKYDVIVSKET